MQSSGLLTFQVVRIPTTLSMHSTHKLQTHSAKILNNKALLNRCSNFSVAFSTIFASTKCQTTTDEVEPVSTNKSSFFSKEDTTPSSYQRVIHSVDGVPTQLNRFYNPQALCGGTFFASFHKRSLLLKLPYKLLQYSIRTISKKTWRTTEGENVRDATKLFVREI